MERGRHDHDVIGWDQRLGAIDDLIGMTERTMVRMKTMMKCECDGCDAYGDGQTLFGDLRVRLCTRHIRMWALDERVIDMMREHEQIKSAQTVMLAMLSGGHAGEPGEAQRIYRDGTDRRYEILIEARQLAVAMFGLDGGP